MPFYKVSGTIMCSWSLVVEAPNEDEAVIAACDRAEDDDVVLRPCGSPDYDDVNCTLVKEKKR